jgi:membrane-bound lytic murein transglycosylase B
VPIFILAGLLAACASGQPAGTASARGGKPSFTEWLNAFQANATKQGISRSTLRLAFKGVTYDPKVIELDNYQPEFVRPIGSYVKSRTDPATVARGRQLLRQHRRAFAKVQAKYGVDPAYIVAIWRLETAYGANFGSFDVIRSLATLAYAGRRKGFWQSELMAALRILQRGDIPRKQLVGSWAGAMGHTQFIPSTYLKRAIDGDGDGKRDLWRSLPDVFASTANYLAKAGWKSGLPFGYEVILPKTFPYELADGRHSLKVSEWRSKYGVKPARGRTLKHADAAAAIVLPSGYKGPAFLVFANYGAILRYNNATAYALAVGILAERLKGTPSVVRPWPLNDRLLRRAEKEELQKRLARLGFDPGPVDGKVGPSTRKAIRQFQKSKKFPADGYANYLLLQRVRAASK